MKYVKSLMGKNKLLFQKTLNNLINTLRRADILIFFFAIVWNMKRKSI